MVYSLYRITIYIHTTHKVVVSELGHFGRIYFLFLTLTLGLVQMLQSSAMRVVFGEKLYLVVVHVQPVERKKCLVLWDMIGKNGNLHAKLVFDKIDLENCNNSWYIGKGKFPVFIVTILFLVFVVIRKLTTVDTHYFH